MIDLKDFDGAGLRHRHRLPTTSRLEASPPFLTWDQAATSLDPAHWIEIEQSDCIVFDSGTCVNPDANKPNSISKTEVTAQPGALSGIENPRLKLKSGRSHWSLAAEAASQVQTVNSIHWAEQLRKEFIA